MTMKLRTVWYGAAVDQAVGEAGDAGLKDAGQELLERSLAVVPRLTEALANSAEVVTEEGEVAVTYTSPYAVVQHEDTTFRHPGGKQAKFLEGPLDQGAPELLVRVGLALRRAMPRFHL